MNTVIPLAHPTQCLYIAIDGVAPLAKIQQQRKRRYMTAYKNELIHQFKKTNNIPIIDWDSNCITPGTAFMKSLDTYLHMFFEKQKKHLDFQVILSGSDQPGEGEHKMIQYIKQNPLSASSNNLDMIYGLDADLIMLSLTCDSNSHIVLMRESDDHQTFNYLDINKLREVISKDLPPSDYVALCFLLGNDFLPGLSFLKIKSKGIQTLMNCYKSISSDRLVHYNEKTKKYTLNQHFLTSLFEQLSLLEPHEMQRIHHEWCEAKPFYQNNKQSKLESYVTNMENYPLTAPKRSKLKTELNPSNPKWQAQYYETLFDTHDSAVIQSLTSSYIYGLHWVLNYYFNKYADNSWVYEFNYAPTATDLYMNLLTVPENKSHDDVQLNECIQLMLVIPPSSYHVLPDNIKLWMNHPKIAYMFPSHFQIHTYLKTFLWECPPVLPCVHIRKIIKLIN